jgi:hypothetical protein
MSVPGWPCPDTGLPVKTSKPSEDTRIQDMTKPEF